MSKHRIALSSISETVKAASYAVRGPIVTRAMQLGMQLKQNPGSLPFGQIISCNIGNPQSLQQKPLSYIRDVLSILVNPSLQSRGVDYPPDVVERAKLYLSDIPSAGAYSESQGIRAGELLVTNTKHIFNILAIPWKVRDDISSFLYTRDGVKGDPDQICKKNKKKHHTWLCLMFDIILLVNFTIIQFWPMEPVKEVSNCGAWFL